MCFYGFWYDEEATKWLIEYGDSVEDVDKIKAYSDFLVYSSKLK